MSYFSFFDLLYFSVFIFFFFHLIMDLCSELSRIGIIGAMLPMNFSDHLLFNFCLFFLMDLCSYFSSHTGNFRSFICVWKLYYLPVMDNHKVDSVWMESHSTGFKRIRVHPKPCNNRGVAAIQNETVNHCRHRLIKTFSSKKRRDSSRSSIPRDIMLEILSRVPGRSLVRFRCACKLWNSLFHDSNFISMQLNHAAKNPSTLFGYPHKHRFAFYSFQIEAGKVVQGNKFTVNTRRSDYWQVSNACNGLIAFYGNYCAYVANPCTREWMALPKGTPHGEDSDLSSTALQPFLGLGFSAATGKHKLVCLFSRDGRTWACEILTLGTDLSWRSLGHVPYRATKFQPAYANGSIYWTIDGRHYAGPERILSFDIGREEFTAIRPPECRPDPIGAANYYHFSMCVLEGSLCAVDWRMHMDRVRRCYWPVMRIYGLKKQEQDYIWTERHKFRFNGIAVYPKYDVKRDAEATGMFPVSIQNGKVLLYRPNETWELHDIRSGTCSKLKLAREDRNSCVWSRAIPFACEESIVPIDWLKN